MPDAIYFKDKESRFIRANPGDCRIFGADSEDAVLGKTDADFFSADEEEEYRADEQRIISTGEPLIGKEEYELPRRLRTSKPRLKTVTPT